MKKGVQLYSIKDLVNKSMDEALKTVSKIGYEGVEFASFGEHTATEILAMLEKYNLQVLGAHINQKEIFNNADSIIAFNQIIGNKRIIIPYYNLKTRKDVIEFANKIKAISPKYQSAGMKLFYHNHDHEFLMDGNDCLIDILANEVSADILGFEFDVYWIYRKNQDPLNYLNKYVDRIEIFHAKDGINKTSTTLGKGDVDMVSVFDFARKNNLAWAVVESEASNDYEGQIESISQDYKAMVGLIQN